MAEKRNTSIESAEFSLCQFCVSRNVFHGQPLFGLTPQLYVLRTVPEYLRDLALSLLNKSTSYVMTSSFSFLLVWPQHGNDCISTGLCWLSFISWHRVHVIITRNIIDTGGENASRDNTIIAVRSKRAMGVLIPALKFAHSVLLQNELPTRAATLRSLYRSDLLARNRQQFRVECSP
jgi:hypothetical protein